MASRAGDAEASTSRTGRAPGIDRSGWRVGRLEIQPVAAALTADSGAAITEVSGFRMEVEAVRNWQSFALREILPLAFIVSMSCALFWLPVTEAEIRVGTATAALNSKLTETCPGS